MTNIELDFSCLKFLTTILIQLPAKADQILLMFTDRSNLYLILSPDFLLLANLIETAVYFASFSISVILHTESREHKAFCLFRNTWLYFHRFCSKLDRIAFPK